LSAISRSAWSRAWSESIVTRRVVAAQADIARHASDEQTGAVVEEISK
jgi:hypothetical protein